MLLKALVLTGTSDVLLRRMECFDLRRNNPQHEKSADNVKRIFEVTEK